MRSASQGYNTGTTMSAQPGAASVAPAALKQVMAQYPTGVTVVTSIGAEGAPRGLLVGTFVRVSDEPALVGFIAMHSSRTWQETKTGLTRFCVNIIGDHQEPLCTAVTMFRADAIAMLPQTTSAGGNPALHGALAHIDCEVQRIVPIGDHDLVIGRVEHARLVSSATPMLYHRGSYARLTETELTARERLLRTDLDAVTTLMPELERLAAATGLEVTINVVDGEDTVVIAAAGRTIGESVAVRVGQRLPFHPPFGSLEAAFGPSALREQWLASGTLARQDSRAHHLAALAAVRERGYAVAFDHLAHERIAAAAAKLGRRETATRADALGQLHDLERFYNVLPSPYQTMELRLIAVPVYGPEGSLAFGLTLWGPRRPIAGAEFEKLAEAARAAAQRCTVVLQSAEVPPGPR